MCCFTQIFSYPIPVLRSSKGFPEPLVVCGWSNLQQISFQQFPGLPMNPYKYFAPHHLFQEIPHHTTVCFLRKHLHVLLNLIPAGIILWFFTSSVICFQAEKSWPTHSFHNIPCWPSLIFPNFNKYTLLRGSVSATIHIPIAEMQQTYTVKNVFPFVLFSFSKVWFHVVFA